VQDLRENREAIKISEDVGNEKTLMIGCPPPHLAFLTV
jgi:hypothetical protein